jgi:PAS domain-containing protein
MSDKTPLVGLDDLRQRKVVFDNTWTLTTVLTAIGAACSWYFNLSDVDIAPVIWTLAALAILQFTFNALAERAVEVARFRHFALCSHATGILVLGAAWHLDGGLQQPTIVMLMLLPLFCGVLIFDFWQQQLATVLVLLVLASGVLLSADTNSFIEQRYGLDVLNIDSLPAWLPRSRVAFVDVSTSPRYNLMLTGTIALLALALSATARNINALSSRFIDRAVSLQAEATRAQALAAQLITNSPSSEVVVAANTGRVLHASDRFRSAFDVAHSETSPFLLDVIAFAYPSVIKRLMQAGGEEIQAATVRGREAVLRIRGSVIDSSSSPLVRLNIEGCEDICWRRSVDALSEPVFAVDSRGDVAFLNRAAVEIFGPDAEGAAATLLLESGPGNHHWWDIAPLESARRLFDMRGRRYLASIRRERVAASVGELSFIHLHEREHAPIAAVS